MIAGAGENGPKVLVKTSQAIKVSLDDLVLLKDVELSSVWVNKATGLNPESLVVPGLAKVELKANNGAKRKAGALQFLVVAFQGNVL